MYYTHPGCQTSIFGENRAYCIRDFTLNVSFSTFQGETVDCTGIMLAQPRENIHLKQKKTNPQDKLNVLLKT